MTLSQKLKKLRDEKNITQMELAEKLDVTVSTIRNYEMESNPRKPTIKVYTKLAEFFNVPIEYLMYDEIENTTTENIKINELLGLNDEAIEFLKQMKDLPEVVNISEEINKFLNYKKIDDFFIKIKYLRILNSYNNFIKKLEKLYGCVDKIDLKTINIEELIQEVNLYTRNIYMINPKWETYNELQEVKFELEGLSTDDFKYDIVANDFYNAIRDFIIMHNNLKSLLKFEIDEILRDYLRSVEEGE